MYAAEISTESRLFNHFGFVRRIFTCSMVESQLHASANETKTKFIVYRVITHITGNFDRLTNSVDFQERKKSKKKTKKSSTIRQFSAEGDDSLIIIRFSFLAKRKKMYLVSRSRWFCIYNINMQKSSINYG